MRAALIAAVSSADQAAETKYSIPSQLQDTRATASARDWEVVAEVVIPGFSRSYDWLHEIVRDVPEYARLVDLVTAEAVDVLVVRDYDRLWRTDALRAQMQVLCEQHRVQFYSLNQPTEVQDPDDLREVAESTQLTQMLFGWSAQTENQLRERRRRMGLRGRIQRGLGLHWTHAPYGYRYVDADSPLEVDPARARWLRWIYEERAKGTGYANLAAQLNEQAVPTSQGGRWSDNALKVILRNPVYVGKVVYRERQRVGPRRGRRGGKRRLVAEHVGEGAHEPLIPQELWDQVQRINAANRRQYSRSTEPAHIMTGILKCGFCGKAMIHMRSHTNHYYYLRCSTYNRSMGRECQPNQVAVTKVLAYVVDAVETALANREGFMASYEAEQRSEEARDRRELLRAEMVDVQQRKIRLLTALETGAFPLEALVGRQADLDYREKHLRAQIAELDAVGARAEAMRASLDRYAAYAGRLAEQPDDDLRAVLLNLIRSVSITKGAPPAIEWL